MEQFYATGIFLFVLFLLLGSGVWVGLSLLGVAWVGMELFTTRPAGDAMMTIIWSASSSWTLTALPLFIWMGEILFRTRLSEDMFKGLSPWMASLPGGLVRPGETMAAAARRELGEETGLECTELSGPVDWNEIILKDAAGAAERHYVIAAFTGHWQGGEAIAGDDAADVRWCEAGELAALELAPGTRGAIAKAARQIS